MGLALAQKRVVFTLCSAQTVIESQHDVAEFDSMLAAGLGGGAPVHHQVMKGKSVMEESCCTCSQDRGLFASDVAQSELVPVHGSMMLLSKEVTSWQWTIAEFDSMLAAELGGGATANKQVT